MKIPKKKELNKKQIQRRVNFYRMIYSFTAPFIGKHMRNLGKEMFLVTNAGKVRVLGYNMDNKNKQPVYVNIHGGGFTMGSPDTDDRYMASLAKNANIKIVSIDYSLAPEAMFPRALEECYGVVKYLKDNANELSIDSNNIAIGGQSAGGNLSAAVSLLDVERKLLGLKMRDYELSFYR